MRTISFFLLSVMMQTVCFAQVSVEGSVVNERGEAIEYVSIGFDEDSVGVISDAKGHFTLKIPAGRKKELSFSHVSYLTTEVPYQEYSKGKPLTVVLALAAKAPKVLVDVLSVTWVSVVDKVTVVLPEVAAVPTFLKVMLKLVL